MNIPLAKPYLGNEEYFAIKPILDSGWLGMGATVGDFEKKVASFIGCKTCVAVNTGTSAIHLALEAVNVREKEVIVPSMTYAATVQAILVAGGIPVFAEIREDDLNIDVDDAYSKITPRTKAIVPVHYAGKPVDMEKLLEISNKKGIIVVEDAAHAFASSYKQKKIGSFGHLTCFSFDPIKTITCGEGGAVCTNNTDLSEKISNMRVLGISRNTWDRYKSERPWFYEVIDKGYRYHMSNINAAIGIEQLKKVEDIVRKRRHIASRYDMSLKNIPGVILLEHDLNEVVPFCYTLLVKDGRRDKFMDAMKECGIGVSVLYPPNHQQPFFKAYKANLPVTEKLANEMVSIPLFTGMTDEQVDYVIEKVRGFIYCS